MPDYRRYRPRRSEAPRIGFGRSIILVLLLGGLLWLGKVWFFQPPTTTSNNDNIGITLVNDTLQSTSTNTNSGVTNVNASSTITTDTKSWGSFSVKQCPTAISTLRTAKQVVLTVGLSADNEQTTAALAALTQAGVPADIFVSGSFANNHPETVKRFAEAGFPIYSQSYDGSDLAVKKEKDAQAAITSAETAIQQATGTLPKPLFRPPQGSYTPATITLLNRLGYCAFLWTVDAYDWQAAATVATSQQRVLDAVEAQRGGAIVALHAGYDITPELITSLVTTFKEKGWTIVSAATALTEQ